MAKKTLTLQYQHNGMYDQQRVESPQEKEGAHFRSGSDMPGIRRICQTLYQSMTWQQAHLI